MDVAAHRFDEGRQSVGARASGVHRATAHAHEDEGRGLRLDCRRNDEGERDAGFPLSIERWSLGRRGGECIQHLR